MNSLRHSFSVFLLLLLFIAVNCIEGLYFFYQQPVYPRDCTEVYSHCSSSNSSGVYTIKPDGYPKPFEVYCNNEFLPGGWTVIKRQLDGSITSTRTWEDFRNGFGFLSSEFYIGNDKLSYLTNQGVYELRIDMMLSNGSFFYIKYNKFRISDEYSQYALVNAEEFSGNSSCVATSCPIEMVHESCTCGTSCSDLSQITDCREICVETCIPKGCFVSEINSYILGGEFYSDSGCTKMCSCSNGQLTCDNSYRCDVNAVCERRSDYHQCYCIAGFSGDGVTCQSICRPNEVYGTCTSEKSCANPTGSVSCTRNQGCYCPNGFYLQGEDCVRQQDCRCFIDGIIIPEGQSYSDSACTKRCFCNNGQRTCDNNYQCDVNAVCERRSNYHKCYCNEGYSGDGVSCQSICRPNEVYGTCTSEKFCANPTGSVSCTRDQGCYCPNGFYLQGEDCVRQQDCRCFIDGIIIPEGQSYSDSACTKRCSCNNGQRTCDNNYRCDVNAVCERRSNYHKCYCNEGYSGDGDSCRSICRTNEVYGTCSCQKSCANPTGCISCTGGQGCYCPDGFYLQGGDCVRQDQCGCYIDGNILRDGDTYVSSGCTRRCSCNNNRLNCDNNYRCHSNAACSVNNNIRRCYCNEGFSGDGVNCQSICSTNEVYGTCSCQKSCTNPTSCVSCSGRKCYCPNGFYLQGGDCVRRDQCGCYIDGNILQDGDTYVNSGCTRRCTCNSNRLNCDNNYRCSPNAVCGVRNSVRQCYCNPRYEGDGSTCTRLYTDCNDVKNAGNTRSDVYSIRPAGYGSSFDVFCNMEIDGGGWTVFQRRINGATNFYRNWASYKNGFGNIRQEFWLGNEKLYYLTQQATYEYRLDFVYSSRSYHHKYSRFRINNESNKYRVTDVGSRSGTRGESLYNTRNIAFSTYDRDNDGQSSTDCAEVHLSGWWSGGYYYSYSYSYCYYYPEGSRSRWCSYANPNGDYNGGDGRNIYVRYYYYFNCHITYTEMKIRRTS